MKAFKSFVFVFWIGMINLCYSQTNVQDSVIVNIEKQIKLPQTPNYQINVLDFGAKGDGKFNNKKAFDKAMAYLSKHGGGMLVVPKGNFKVNGPIHFVSHVNLHLEEGSKITFGDNPKDYPNVLTSWEGTMLYNHSPFIYGIDLTDVSITGKGTIDGDGGSVWATWKSKEGDGKDLSRKMNHEEQSLEARVFGEGFYLRPQLIQFVSSKNILIEGITIEDAPFWCVHILKSSSITLRDLKYNAHNKNNDGIDIEHSKLVLIEKVSFDNGDDNIAIKAGRDHDGRNANMPSKQIIVRDCTFKGLHALVIGSEMSSGVEDVYAYNCKASGYLKRGIYIKTNSDRGGYIRNIHFNQLDFQDVEDAIYITSNYHGEGSGLFPSEISNLYFSNLSFTKASNTAIVVEGYPEKPVENIYFDFVEVGSSKNGMTVSKSKNVQVNEVVIGEKQTVPSAVN
ncbi:glycoside hydrolase family 28 protein [Mangrovimonas futianensis]|uniref:glycoside hydrolase family 28 protein n=1 Tax=Mangrovimonas futianensis TaxID=2895523 RepID=UPI001E2ADC44|nr:glycoside hydrolase family 28 protein [Mangrovimonas futianensis]MCF1420452.1 glycoside hydrolase family 28 protein [Mangrovimonas futianensis]